MEFRLIYQGKLPAEGRGSASSRKEKHDIRRAVHQQLARLWNTHPFIAEYAERKPGRVYKHVPIGLPDGSVGRAGILSPSVPSTVDKISLQYRNFGFEFVPLIGSAFGEGTETVCSLDILFLRREIPGVNLIGGGDLDNRLKVLFDALRMPKSDAEVEGFKPQAGEVPFFCLLEDDSLITEIKVTADQLLAPLGSGEHKNDVYLVIHVTTLAAGARLADIGMR